MPLCPFLQQLPLHRDFCRFLQKNTKASKHKQILDMDLLGSIVQYFTALGCQCGHSLLAALFASSNKLCSGAATTIAGITLFDEALLWGLLVFGITAFLLLFFINAPYGKFHDTWGGRGGFSVNGK